MSKMMVKRDDLWTPMANLKGNTGPLPADNSVTNDALVTDGAKTNTAYLMGNRLTKDSEGELISVDDSYPSAVLNLTVDGKSTQLTTTGKNLWGGDAMVGPTGYLEDEFGRYGTNRDTGAIKRTDIEFKENTPYTLFLYGKRGTTAHAHAMLRIFYTDGSAEYVNWTSGNSLEEPRLSRKVLNSDGDKTINYITPNTGFSGLPRYYIDKCGLFEGAVGMDEFEPYSNGQASPSPDAPQEIESLTDIPINVYGANILNPEDIVQGTIDGAGALYSNSTIRCITPMFHIPRQITAFAATSGIDVGWIFYNKFKYYIAGQTSWGATRSIPENAEFVRFIFRKSDESDIIPQDVIDANTQISFMTAKEYEPYSGNYAQLQDITLRSLPDGTKDELNLTYLRPSTRKGWAWYSRELVKKINTVTFDGSERWVANGAWNGFHIARPSDAPSEGLPTNAFLNTRGIAAVHSKAGLASALGATSFGSNSINYNWDNETGTSYSGHLTEFKAWLTENNMTIQYLLAAPITTQLDPIELPIMQAGTTNIWTDPSTSLSVTYERDRNIVISKLEAAAADLATS